MKALVDSLRVMKVEDGVEGRVVNNRHVSTATDQAMDLVMDRFYAVVVTTIAVRDPGFVAEISVIGIRCEEIVQAITERQSVVVKLM